MTMPDPGPLVYAEWKRGILRPHYMLTTRSLLPDDRIDNRVESECEHTHSKTWASFQYTWGPVLMSRGYLMPVARWHTGSRNMGATVCVAWTPRASPKSAHTCCRIIRHRYTPFLFEVSSYLPSIEQVTLKVIECETSLRAVSGLCRLTYEDSPATTNW